MKLYYGSSFVPVHARSLENKLLSFLIGLLMISFLTVALLITLRSRVHAGYDHLNTLVNSHRSTRLISSPTLDVIAYCRATYIATNGFSHNNYQLCVTKHHGKYPYGEILAMGYPNDEETVIAWMNSASHNHVIRNKWKFIGSSKVGIYTVVTFH